MNKDSLVLQRRKNENNGDLSLQGGFPDPGACDVLRGQPRGDRRTPFAAFRAEEGQAPPYRSFLARIKYDSLDSLDKWALLIIALAIIYGAALLVSGNGLSQAGEDDRRRQPAPQLVMNPELDNKIQQARDLLVRENLDKTEMLVDSLLGEFPYEGRLHMLKGDILVRRQQPVDAMYAYKEAVELHPDFLDKKAELFQGKKIKVTVEEALAAIEAGLKGNPDDTLMKDHLQTVYFMKRKLAGGCG
ncbi:MAG: hypothetical protein RBR09_13260 [Desulfobulbaceae bacterium]|jgi:tetratricopeptide (TPR) repeat protein|nr:hypothetical protein [Desulfobulbaceae bacterium]